MNKTGIKTGPPTVVNYLTGILKTMDNNSSITNIGGKPINLGGNPGKKLRWSLTQMRRKTRMS